MNRTPDKQAYANLLAEAQPKVIETESENERLLAEVEKLMSLGEDLTPEQEQLLKLLVACNWRSRKSLQAHILEFRGESHPITLFVQHRSRRIAAVSATMKILQD